MNRSEYLQWAKDRALAYLEPVKPMPQHRAIAYSGGYSPWGEVHHPGNNAVSADSIREAYTSFVSDLGKHPDLASHVAIGLGMIEMMSGRLTSAQQMREFIEGTN